MFKNYVTVALRNIRRHAGYAAINVFGLALGIAVCVLILLYVRDELTHDHFHQHADETYLLRTQKSYGETGRRVFFNPEVPMVDALVQASPDLRQAVRLVNEGRLLVRRGEERFYEEKLRYTEPAFFSVFDFPLQAGDPATALARPNTVVLTAAAAERYFGTTDPVGATLTFVGEEEMTFEVTGVLAPMPTNTTFDFAVLASVATLEPAFSEGNVHLYGQTFLLAAPGTPPGQIEAHVRAQLADGEQAEHEVLLSSLKALHLSRYSTQRGPGLSGNVRYLYIFGGIALLVLLIGCVNFVNLTTAQALRRAKEVGVRKAVGAGRGQLMAQYLGETLLYSLAAMCLAVALAELALPLFNTLVGKQLTISYFSGQALALWLVGLWLLVGLLAGVYPALVLSGFQPLQILRGRMGRGAPGQGRLRQALVVFQFAISIALVTALLVVQQQLAFLQQQNADMQPDQVVMLGTYGEAGTNYQAFKSQLLQVPGVAAVSVGNFPNAIGLPSAPEGLEQESMLSSLLVDTDFLRTMQLPLRAGRDFDPEKPGDLNGSVLVNEAAVEEFGWQDGLGKTITRYPFAATEGHSGRVTSTVIGVVEDFPVTSLKYETGAVMIMLNDNPQVFGEDVIKVLVRVRAGDMAATLPALRTAWESHVPDHPFTYEFLDETFAAFYTAERQLGKLFATFAMLAVLIACLGLFGLAVYTAETRTKELGIRKVLGASVPGLVYLLSREFLLLIGGAFLLAAPLAYLAMQRWLEDFAHRIDLGLGVFLLAGGGILLLALLTVASQAFRAATADPVRSLRYE